MPAGTLLGIDLGHSHATVMVAESSGEQLVLTEPEIVDVDRNGPSILRDLAEQIDKALSEAGRDQASILAIGLGLPAPVNAASKIAARGYLSKWDHVDIREKLLAVLPDVDLQTPIAIENDANLGALSEQAEGLAVGQNDFMYAKLSTGIGVGAILAGAAYRGSKGRALEIGHRRVPAEAERIVAKQSTLSAEVEPCQRCGRLDCLENLASGAAIMRTLDKIVDAARNHPVDKPKHREVVINAAIRIGATLADAAELLDPSMIVLGGTLSKLGYELEDQLTTWLNMSTRAVEVRVRRVAEDDVEKCEVRGAVRLAREHARRNSVNGSD